MTESNDWIKWLNQLNEIELVDWIWLDEFNLIDWMNELTDELNFNWVKLNWLNKLNLSEANEMNRIDWLTE